MHLEEVKILIIFFLLFVIKIFLVPNRFINPKCGDKWDSSDSQDYTLTQYITPERVRFYRIHPNYFFGSGSRTIAIKTLNPNDALTVCFSRSDVNPRANKTSGTSGDVRCEQVVGKEYAYTMDNPCADKQFIHDCPPLYFSIESGKHLSEDFFTCRGRIKVEFLRLWDIFLLLFQMIVVLIRIR